MKVLLTGASSFSGRWFAEALLERGHCLTVTYTGAEGSYEGLRAQRIAPLRDRCTLAWGTAFGDDRFLELLTSERFDALCVHGAYVRDYRSEAFPVDLALASNTRRLAFVLDAGKAHGLSRLILTGSVFEADEGVGERPLRAFSPYGLSKTLTAQVFRFWCERKQIPLLKFVIPNPFGPYEEPRFTHFLMSNWVKGATATVKTPSYVRDNIHVSLLATAYADCAAREPRELFEVVSPSGYVESQGAFARRFAREIGQRLHLECPLELAEQTDFSEPRVRINTDVVDSAALGWVESAAWDTLAAYYRSLFTLAAPA